jgi:hypothetical protein
MRSISLRVRPSFLASPAPRRDHLPRLPHDVMGLLCGECQGWIVILAGGLAAPPTVTTKFCVPVGTFCGMLTLIWTTPTDHDGTPWYTTGHVTPPTVTVMGCTGWGNVLPEGVAPVGAGGVTAPAPVMYSAMLCPRLALAVGFSPPVGVAEMPGAAAYTRKCIVSVWPLLFTVNWAFPIGVWYGIWTFNRLAGRQLLAGDRPSGHRGDGDGRREGISRPAEGTDPMVAPARATTEAARRCGAAFGGRLNGPGVIAARWVHSPSGRRFTRDL